METISVEEAFARMKKEKPLVILYTLKNTAINSTLEQVSSQIGENNKIVPILKVEIDANTLTREEARKLGIIRLPQLRFYNGSALLATITGQVSSSDIYEKILSLYA